jgi:hypothetical protein
MMTLPIQDYEKDVNIYWVIAECGHTVTKVVGDKIEPCMSCQGLKEGADKQLCPGTNPVNAIIAPV